MRIGRTFFVLVLLVCIVETIRLWALSPGDMAVHFNAQGIPDRFASKAEFFSFQAQVLAVATGLGILLQVLVRIVPLEWIRVPNRAYWLAAEHRNSIHARLSSFAAILFGLILLVVLAGFELAVSANLHQPVVFQAQMMVPILAGFILVSLILLIWLVGSFRIPRVAEQIRRVS